MNSGIYKLYWDNYFYIGQSIDINKRYKQHINKIINNKHENSIVQRVSSKYGIPNIEILALCSIDKLDFYEQLFLDKYFKSKHCCNLAPVAKSVKGYKHTLESIEKNRLKSLGKKLSESHKLKIKLGVIDAKKQGKTAKPKFGINNSFYGKKHTNESLIKMRKNKNIGENNIKAKKVIDKSNGYIYNCAQYAADSLGIKGQYLRAMLNGNKKNKTTLSYL